jgi:protein SCO1/2
MGNLVSAKKQWRLIFISIVFAIVALVGFWHFVVVKPQTEVVAQTVKISGTYLPKANPINDFKLTDNHGKPFTKANLQGQWTMMFFGFTNCAYVCPTTLAELKQMYSKLKETLPNNKLPQIVLVTVDPERDSVAIMNEYVNEYNPNFIGVRGDLIETKKLENQLRIKAQKVQAEDAPKDEYSVNHSAEILLFNPKGEIQAYFTYPHTAEKLVNDYNLVLDATP